MATRHPTETSPLLAAIPEASTASDTSSLMDSDSESDDSSLPAAYGIYSPNGSDLEARRELANPKPRLKQGHQQATILQVILVLLIGVFTSNADGSLVLATHPVIASEFQVLADSSWLFISFALAGAATQTLVSFSDESEVEIKF
jgi:hypothetical protein